MLGGFGGLGEGGMGDCWLCWVVLYCFGVGAMLGLVEKAASDSFGATSVGRKLGNLRR